ncbi:unnamed protein product [Pocillopora meandrina]|uniref:DZIP3-like HEPN domain-containing protein n=1 Tax=Pocillopora meandrina TaxID=46732 RepID=A0AAU9WWG4_9CNID|nr:unnamed protein product [Pocillopora meandrina]
MASAAPTALSTKETTNYARLCRLLVDIGTQALRDTFDAIHAPGNLHSVLAAKKPTLQSLRKQKVINHIQWGKLYPAILTSVSSRDFDTTLLMVLLRNLCGLTAPPTGWDAFPAITDLSKEADIARVKYFRNTVYGHAEKASVDDVKFNDYWRDIRDTLVRLGGVTYEAAIDNLRNECMDPEVEGHFLELLSQWKKDENSIKDQLDVITKNLEVLTSKDEVSSHALFLMVNKFFVPDQAPFGNRVHRENHGSSILGKLTGNVDLHSGQFTFKGRVISYNSRGRFHSFGEPWVYDASACDIESGISCKERGYHVRYDAVQNAVEKLKGMLKSEGLLYES